MNMNATAQMVTVSQGGKPREKPKPATGEWTVETIAAIRGKDGDFGLAAAINAAIAIEREKHVVSEGLLIEANKELRQQLAIERVKGDAAIESLRHFDKQLAALADALHFYRNHDDNGQTATDALRKVGK